MLKIKKNVLVFLFLIIATTKSFALIGVPEVYVSAGVSSSSSLYKNATTGATPALVSLAGDSLKDTTSKYGSTALNLAVGITPLNLPLFNTLRLELQYYNNFGKVAKISSIGGVAYLDLRIIPFVTPYLGFGVHAATIKTQPLIDPETKDALESIDGSLTGDKTTNNAALYSLHAGANVKIPLAGLAVFAEYKVQLGAFDKKVKINIPLFSLDENLKVKTFAVNHGIVVGVKYFIL